MSETFQSEKRTWSFSAEALFGRVLRGAGALSLGAIIGLLGRVSIVPLALHVWGENRYGEWVVLTGLVFFLRITDLGLQTYVVNRMCASYATGELKDFQRVLHAALKIHVLLVIGVLMVLAAGLELFSLKTILRFRAESAHELNVAVLLLATEIFLGVPMGVVAGSYRATGHLSRGAMFGAVQSLGLWISTLGLIWLNAGFALIAAGRLACALLITILLIWDLKRLHPWLHLWPAGGSWAEGVRMIGPGLYFLLIPVSNFVYNQFALMFIQRTMDGGTVSRLSTHQMMVNFALMAGGFLLNASWPEFTALGASGGTDRLRMVHRSLVKFNLWGVGLLMMSIPVAALWVYPLWTLGRLSLDGPTLLFLEARMLLWAVWSSSMTVLLAINHQRKVALAHVGSAFVTAFFVMMLVPIWGMRGAAFSALLGDMSLMAWLLPLLVFRHTGESRIGFCREIGAAAVWVLVLPAVVGLLLAYGFSFRGTGFVIGLGVSLGLASMQMWRQLAPHERRVIANQWRGLQKKIRFSAGFSSSLSSPFKDSLP